MMAAPHATGHVHIDIVPDICTLTCTFLLARSSGVHINEVWIIKVGLYNAMSDLSVSSRSSRLLITIKFCRELS